MNKIGGFEVRHFFLWKGLSFYVLRLNDIVPHRPAERGAASEA